MTERASKGTGPAADFVLGGWLVQPSLNRISRGDDTIRLRPQLMNLLVCLADRAGQVVTRDEIFAVVWPSQYVAESGLVRCIAELRQALGDAARADSKYIETISKRGYRLVAPIAAAPARAAVAGAATAPAGPIPATVESGRAPAIEPRTTDGSDRASAAAGSRAGETPRRSVLMAVAIGLVIVGASAFFAWHTLGGPRLDEHDTLVIAFDNTTGDPVFDGALRLALSTQIEQSPSLRVVSEQRVRDEFRFMNRPADTVISRAVALEVCQRVGAKAAVVGSVAALGRHYAIGLEGVACQSGDVIARQQVEAADKEHVLDALGQAASAIRERLGESVVSIRRYDVPIAQATTASIDALKAFSQGDFERARGRDEDAVRFFRRAIEIDSSFALAHMRLGLQLLNLSRYGEGIEELKQAYAVRERATEAERFYITSFYHTNVLRDPIKGVEPLEKWRDSYPKSAVARFTVASLYDRIGRRDEALQQAQEAVRLEPDNALANDVLTDAMMRLGRLVDARRRAEEQIANGRGGALVHSLLAQLAFALDDRALLAREIEWSATESGAATIFLDVQSAQARFGGRMQEAARLAERRMALAEQHGDRLLAAIAGLEEANDRALAGQTREPIGLVLAALQKARTPETVIRGALALAWAGEVDRAEQLLREYEKMPDVVPTSDPDVRPAVIAAITLARGFPESAIEAMVPLRPYELGWRFNFLPAYIRGLALARLNRPRDAAVEFERVVTHRGAVPESAVYALAWLQLGRARTAAGDPKGARAAFEQFLNYWKDADANMPALAEARQAISALPAAR